MLTFLGLKVSYETLAFLALFIASEVVGNSKLKATGGIVYKGSVDITAARPLQKSQAPA